MPPGRIPWPRFRLLVPLPPVSYTHLDVYKRQAAFCAAAALPHLHPELRRKLLQSISEAAATASGWSARQPSFFPHWVEKVEENAAN